MHGIQQLCRAVYSWPKRCDTYEQYHVYSGIHSLHSPFDLVGQWHEDGVGDQRCDGLLGAGKPELLFLICDGFNPFSFIDRRPEEAGYRDDMGPSARIL